MAEDFTAFTQAVADLKGEILVIVNNMDALLADLKTASPPGNQPAVDAATAAIEAQVQALQAAATRDMPPAPTSPPPTTP